MSTSMSIAWQEYRAASGKLGELRRAAAAVATERAGAAEAVRQELAGTYRRLLLQRSQLVDAATRAGLPVPPLAPDPADVAAALAAMTTATNPPVPARNRLTTNPGFVTARSMAPDMISIALRGATRTLDTADAMLFATGTAWGRPDRPVTRRNTLVYGGYGVLLAVAQIPFVAALLDERASGIFSLCGLVLPVLAFALGWLTIGAAFRPPPGGRLNRTPVLGALVSLIAAAPVAPLLALAVLSALRG